MLNLNILEKTAESTHIMSSGLSTLHAIPKTERLYLSLKSFATSDFNINQSRDSVFVFA